MASGVETAGLVLAAFPLLVKGVTAYLDGIRTIKYWRRYTRELRGYARRLKSQRVRYINTLELLFDGIVETEDELAALIAEPGGDLWRKPRYQRCLAARLDHSFDHFIDIVQSMQESMEELREKMGLDAQGNVCPLCQIHSTDFLTHLSFYFPDHA